MSRKGDRGRKHRPKYADLHELPEDERIAIIGDRAEAGNLIAVFVDNEPEKVARYIRKMAERYPTVRLIKQTDDALVVKTAGGSEGATLLQFGPALSS